MTAKVPKILVCVTGQRDCDRLIEAGCSISKEIEGSTVEVFSVLRTSKANDALCEELEYLRKKSAEADAEMTIYFDDDPALITAGFARKKGAVHIVTGMPGNNSAGFIDVLHKLLPDTIISMVAKNGQIHTLYPENICPYKDPIRSV